LGDIIDGNKKWFDSRHAVSLAARGVPYTFLVLPLNTPASSLLLTDLTDRTQVLSATLDQHQRRSVGTGRVQLPAISSRSLQPEMSLPYRLLLA
jgi:hypothetical protein